MTFKKGDKVKIIEAAPSYHDGETATYDEPDHEGHIIILNTGKRWFCDEIEPLMDKREQAIYKRLCNIKRPKPKRRIQDAKQGDNVRLRINYASYTKGAIVEVMANENGRGLRTTDNIYAFYDKFEMVQ